MLEVVVLGRTLFEKFEVRDLWRGLVGLSLEIKARFGMDFEVRLTRILALVWPVFWPNYAFWGVR